jgi:glycosyltransferase involved in cell wall biosynthesis
MTEAVAARVDVVLPTHRGRRWVAEAIESVLAQSHRSLHLTVVDDASGDGTYEYVRERYGGTPERVSVLALEAPHRAAGARMEALRRAHGEFVAFIDQDDRWHAEKLERQLARLARGPEAHAVHTDVVHIDDAGREIPRSARGENAARARIDWDELAGGALVRRLFLDGRIRLASALVRRDAFDAMGGFDASLFGGEDWEFWVRLAAGGHRLAHLPEPLLERRVHAGNVSTTHEDERLEGRLAAIDRVLARHPELSDLAPARRATLLRADAIRKLEAGRPARARSRLRELREIEPGSRAAQLLWLASLSGPLSGPMLRLARRLRPG